MTTERSYESMMIGSLVNLTLWDLLLILLLQTTAFYFVVIATLIAGVIVVLSYAILLRGPPETKPMNLPGFEIEQHEGYPIEMDGTVDMGPISSYIAENPWPPPPPKKGEEDP